MNISEMSQQVPDSVKIAAATSSSVLTFLGLPVEQWMFLLSAVVSVLFIIEKVPMLINRIRQLKEYVKRKKREGPTGG